MELESSQCALLMMVVIGGALWGSKVPEYCGLINYDETIKIHFVRSIFHTIGANEIQGNSFNGTQEGRCEVVKVDGSAEDKGEKTGNT